MATAPISEAEASRDLHSLLLRARGGEKIEIGSDLGTFRMERSDVADPKLWNISEAIRRAKEDGSTIILDDKFGDDLE